MRTRMRVTASNRTAVTKTANKARDTLETIRAVGSYDLSQLHTITITAIRVSHHDVKV
jgi:hypothetical protein